MERIQEAIPQYVILDEQLKEFESVSQQLQKQTSNYEQLQVNIKKRHTIYENVKAENTIMLQKIRKYSNVNVKSIISDVKGKKDDRLAHYHRQHQIKTQEEDAAKQAYEQTKHDLDATAKLIEQLKNKKQQLDGVKPQMNALFERVFHDDGIPQYPEEHSMATEVRRLTRELNNKTRQINAYTTAHAHLQHAEKGLRSAFTLLSNRAHTTHDAATFCAQAHGSAKAAYSRIQQALDAVPNKELNSILVDGNLRSYMQSLQHLDQLKQHQGDPTETIKLALRNVQQVHGDVQNAMKWLENSKREALPKHDQLRQLREPAAEALFQKRRQIFEEVMRGERHKITETVFQPQELLVAPPQVHQPPQPAPRVQLAASLDFEPPLVVAPYASKLAAQNDEEYAEEPLLELATAPSSSVTTAVTSGLEVDDLFDDSAFANLQATVAVTTTTTTTAISDNNNNNNNTAAASTYDPFLELSMQAMKLYNVPAANNDNTNNNNNTSNNADFNPFTQFT